MPFANASLGKASVHRRCVRPPQADGQDRLSGVRHRSHPTIRYPKRLPDPTSPLGGWMTRWRRLVRDYEARIDVSKAMILVAMGGNLLRRTTHP